MRWGLVAWCILGATLIGLKAHLDMMGRDMGNVAVRTSAIVYHIPEGVIVRTDHFSADIAKLAGCWDARLDSVLPRAWFAAWCSNGQVLELSLAAKHLGVGVADVLREQPLIGVLRSRYVPATEQLGQAMEAWLARGDWAGRQVVASTGGALVRMQSPQSPWAILLTREPVNSNVGSLAQVYAGRCYRPDQFSDIGMTCEIAQRLDRDAAFEYTLDQDNAPSHHIIHAAVEKTFNTWRVK